MRYPARSGKYFQSATRQSSGQQISTFSKDSTIDECASEPIHIPGAIQPHGALVVLRASDITVLSASTNCQAVLGCDLTLGQPLPAVLAGLGNDGLAAAIARWQASGQPQLLRTVELPGGGFQFTGHVTDQGLLCEFEPHLHQDPATLDALYPRLRSFLDRLEGEKEIEAIARHASREMRQITRFGRVLVYRFDEDGHGTVIAEDGDGSLPSFLGHRFPASDIPAQARALYVANRVRLIADAYYAPCPLSPEKLDGAPIDLSQAALRSVSPIHLEYMRNMGTLASMSISLVIDGRLWGLMSCHHPKPQPVGPQVRAACEFLGRIVAQQIGSAHRLLENTQKLQLKRLETRLVARLTQTDSFHEGLASAPAAWLQLCQAHGAALVDIDSITTAGVTPSDEAIRAITAWLQSSNQPEVFATDHLAAVMPGAAAFTGQASGLIAASISQLHARFILWFRPEIVKTVKWSGDPHKPAGAGAGRLRPRKSFETWQEQVHERAERWSLAEVDAVEGFRHALINYVLLRAEERAEMSGELARSNAELESFSYSVSHDLRAPFRHIAGFAELLKRREKDLDTTSRHYLENIVTAAVTAGTLVDDLLRFSHLGRAAFAMAPVDMNKLASEVRQSIDFAAGDRKIEWRIGDLPRAWGDQNYIRQALFNLMDNAAKYTRREPHPVVTVTGQCAEEENVYVVADNGVGFDMEYVHKLFGVFQRLHKAEDFDGTGIGLALSQRIVEKHGGRIVAHGIINQGAQFTFALPNKRTST